MIQLIFWWMNLCWFKICWQDQGDPTIHSYRHGVCIFPPKEFASIWSFLELFAAAMGGVCSRKRGNQVNEDGVRVGVNRRYCKNGSSKWLQGTPFFRTTSGCQPEDVSCPSLMELCIHKARQVRALVNVNVLSRR